tara:strand:+ start:310 stop:567 length:258 start_codon:yes stop_codon:yes gene_type:complete
MGKCVIVLVEMEKTNKGETMSLSRKHFEKIGKIIETAGICESCKNDLVHKLSDYFSGENVKFDKVKFAVACLGSKGLSIGGKNGR